MDLCNRIVLCIRCVSFGCFHLLQLGTVNCEIKSPSCQKTLRCCQGCGFSQSSPPLSCLICLFGFPAMTHSPAFFPPRNPLLWTTEILLRDVSLSGWPGGLASASDVGDVGIPLWSSQTSDIKIDTLVPVEIVTHVATLSDAWCCAASVSCGRPGVSIPWLDEIENLMQVLIQCDSWWIWGDPPLQYTLYSLGRLATKERTG